MTGTPQAESGLTHKAPPQEELLDGFKRSLKVGAACGVAGTLFGGTAGIIKFGGSSISSAGVAPFLFAGASGLQTFALGTTFWTFRTTVLTSWTTPDSTPSPSDKIKASAISGGVSGGAILGIVRGRSNIIPGIIMWTIFGSTGQWLYNRVTASKDVDPAPNKTFWERVADRKWSPMTVLSNEEYAVMLKEKKLKVDVEIAVIDDKIVALRKEIEQNEEHNTKVEKRDEP